MENQVDHCGIEKIWFAKILVPLGEPLLLINYNQMISVQILEERLKFNYLNLNKHVLVI